MSNKSEKNQKMLKEMAEVFYPNNQLKKVKCIDFMGYEFDDGYNKPTYHHIEKASSLREQQLSDNATFENGAILGEASHEALHIIEQEDIGLYNDWNNLFAKINASRQEYWDEFMPEIIELQERSQAVLDAYARRTNPKGGR